MIYNKDNVKVNKVLNRVLESYAQVKSSVCVMYDRPSPLCLLPIFEVLYVF